MNYRDIIVFDFETGGRNPHKCQPTQIAAVAVHARKLTLQPGGTFNSEMRPILDDEKAIAAGFDPLEDEALEITRKTRAKLQANSNKLDNSEKAMWAQDLRCFVSTYNRPFAFVWRPVGPKLREIKEPKAR